MTCGELRRSTDALLSGQLTAEAHADALRHLDGCVSCRTEIDGRRRLDAALRGAFNRAPELRPTPEFSERLRQLLQDGARSDRATPMSRRSWLGLAAGLVLTTGLTGRLLFDRHDLSTDALAQDAIGDHRNCALKFRLSRMPVPLSQAADRFDETYRLLITAPPDDIPTPGGPVRVLERHACVYDGRRFGHVVMRYQGHVVSLLLTASGSASRRDVVPREIGHAANDLSVVSVSGSSHSVLMVADLASDELTRLSAIIAQPLAQRLEGRAFATNPQIVAALQSGR